MDANEIPSADKPPLQVVSSNTSATKKIIETPSRATHPYKSANSPTRQKTPQTENKYSTGFISTGKKSRDPEFTPSKSYMHLQKKFEFQKKMRCDRVKTFHRSYSVWESDKFLSNNNYKQCASKLVSREGRKLDLAGFNLKFKDSPAKK